MTYNNKKDESNLAKLFSTIEESKGRNDILTPSGVTKDSMKKYVKDMIKAKQPRFERKDGRKFNIDYYKVPTNYMVVDSNLVNYNASTGIIFMPGVEQNAEEAMNVIREDDLGAVLIHYIFKHGRKTIDELAKELQGYDKHMLTLLVKMLEKDGYLRRMKEKEKGKTITTLELVEKEINKGMEDKNYDKD